ncbi:MAG TPA: DUF2188 domain-containing protein [Candidatus Paceibacterota bacterium]|jgi:hypothetical protein
MTKRRVYHVTPNGDGDWKVKEKGAKRAVKIVEDKTDALSLAKDLAKKAELGQVVVHDKKGVIQTEHTYGKDPEKSPG